MNKKIKILIVLLVVFGIYFCIMFLFLGNDKPKTPINPGGTDNPPKVESKKQIIVFEQNDALLYEEGEWKNSSASNYSNKKLDVYDGNTYVGERYITYNNKWYVFDDNRNFYDLNNGLFAFNGDYDLNVINLNESLIDINDKSRIMTFLNNKGLTYNFEELYLIKYEVDIDRDNILEQFIIINNLSGLDYAATGDEFLLVIAVDNENVSEVFGNTVSHKECDPYLQKVISMDNKTFVIVGCIYPSDRGTVSYIYEKNNNVYKYVYKTEID